MSQEPLQIILQSADAWPNAHLGAGDVNQWPKGALELLLENELLTEAPLAKSVACDECEEGCILDVELITENGIPTSAYSICPEGHGRIRVPLARLRQWQINLTALAHNCADAINAIGGVESIVSDRLWRLGKTSFQGARADVFMARGAMWQDAEVVFANNTPVAECSLPLVFVPWHIPTNPLFGHTAKVVTLGRLLSIDKNAMHLDTAEIQRVIGKGRSRRIQEIVPIKTQPGTDWKNVLIEFANEEVVKIVAGSEAEHRTFAEMGFRDWHIIKVEMPDKLWEFFRSLAYHEGQISWNDQSRLSRKQIDHMKKNISIIRNRMRVVFPDIPGDPFEDYRKVKAYKTKFMLRLSDSSRESFR